MRCVPILLKRGVIPAHRWMGIALCLVFLIWFASGIVMMYSDFPSVSERDRLQHAPALAPASIRLSPADAYARLNIAQPPAQVRLDSFDGRPVYRFRAGRDDKIVYADSGEEQTGASKDMVDRAAGRWAGQPVSAARVEPVNEVDQWTVQARLRSLRPLWKYSWPNGDQVYVAGDSAQVVQSTTRQSRMWAWLGAIPHWLYFTPLRKHQQMWSRVVIWTSGLGTLSAVLGIVIGVWMYSPRKRYRQEGVAASIPYRGWKRWHTWIGLIFGSTAATWAFSGMLSMDPFPVKSVDSAGGSAVDVARALRGRVRLAAFSAKPPAQAIAQLNSPVKELELISFDGQPFYLATLASLETRVVPVNGDPKDGFGAGHVVELLTRALRGKDASRNAELRTLSEYDVYYLDRHRERPLPVVLLRTNDPAESRYYIDPKTARIAGAYNSTRWMTRWLYHALHSWDLPWLYKYRPLWDIVVIAFMLGGSALCVTSLVLAWRVVRRRLGFTA